MLADAIEDNTIHVLQLWPLNLLMHEKI